MEQDERMPAAAGTDSGMAEAEDFAAAFDEGFEQEAAEGAAFAGAETIAERLTRLLMREKPQPSTLYLVGTPLGNAGDLSPRALGILAQADVIAAEDTRRTAELLRYFGFSNRLWSYHQHNEHERGEKLLELLRGGSSVALVTDAGMPAISDPGEHLVDLCHRAGIRVKAVPGPSAGITALAMSGLPSEDFRFVGFLPVKGRPRRDLLESLKTYSGTSLLYEAPHRLRKTLADLAEAGMGGRALALGRELTKQYEEILRGTVSSLNTYYEANEPRGEYVLVLGGPTGAEQKADEASEKDALEAAIRDGIAEGRSDKDILKALAAISDLPKNALKKRITELRRG